MVLLTSVLLQENVDNNRAEVDNIKVITCYGLLVGPLQPLVFLKGRIDFENGMLSFQELFKRSPCLQTPMIADSIIVYILQNLLAWVLAVICQLHCIDMLWYAYYIFELHEKFIHVQCVCAECACVIDPATDCMRQAWACIDTGYNFFVHRGCVTQSCGRLLSSCTLLHLHVFNNTTKAASSGLLLVDTVVSNVAVPQLNIIYVV